MAKYLWQQGSEPLPSALAASWIYGVLAHKLPNYESDLIKSYEKNKEYATDSGFIRLQDSIVSYGNLRLFISHS